MVDEAYADFAEANSLPLARAGKVIVTRTLSKSYSLAGIRFGFAIGRPEFALPACFLVFSFVGTGSSFLAFSAIAAKRGVTTDARGKKAIYYLGGLTEGAETIAVFVLVCVFPDQFAWFAWVFGGLCWLTTASRIYAAVEAFQERT